MPNKIVILYSGGLDSFLLKKYAEITYPKAEVKCIYYKHGAGSEEQEIKRLPSFVDIRTIDWLGEKIQPVAKKDDPFAGKIYIPGRNLIFSALAACQELPDQVWMGTVVDEDNPKGTDKNEEFRSKTSQLLSYVLSPFLNEVRVRFPFVEERWTKLDCIWWALNKGVTEEDIKKTVSCWHQTGDKPCGVCKQCFKRELIFLLSGITQEYVENPMKSEHGKKLLEMYLKAGMDDSVEKNLDEANVYGQIVRCYEQGLFDDDTANFIDSVIPK